MHVKEQPNFLVRFIDLWFFLNKKFLRCQSYEEVYFSESISKEAHSRSLIHLTIKKKVKIKSQLLNFGVQK